MATYKLEPETWQAYFDRVSKHLIASKVEVSVNGLDLGAQVVDTPVLGLSGFSYDPYDKEFVITAAPYEEHIDAREIYVEEERGVLRAIEVIDTDGRVRLIELTPALALPNVH
jgi:hypothetical protein